MRRSLRTFVAMYAHRDSRNGERFIPLSKRRVYFYDQKESAMAVTRQIRRGVLRTNAKTAVYYLVMVAFFFFFYAAFRSHHHQEHYYVNNEDYAMPEDKDILERMHDVTGYTPETSILDEIIGVDNNDKNNKSLVLTHQETDALTDSADWIDIDSRPIPSWFDDAKFGILVHWGIHSLPALQDVILSEGASKSKDIPLHSSYMKLAPKFTAEFFDPKDWSELFNRSGAKYVVMTSKHYDGFPLWPSKYSWNWNSMVVGPNRDLVGELAGSIRNLTGLKFGLYHSLSEWYHPLYQLDKNNQFSTEDYVESKLTPELREMVNNYNPDLVMTDGDAEAPDGYWKSTEFLKWLFNQSPVKEQVVVNDRWGKGCRQKHGGFYTGPDRYNPGSVQDHKWETVYTIHRKSRNYRRKSSLSQFFTSKELVHELIKTVSLGGNMLLAVGPSHDGLISPLFQERLKDLGYWLGINGESIYKTQPWKVQNETENIWFTRGKDGTDAITNPLYAIFLSWPEQSQVELSGLKAEPETVVTLFGFGELKWNQTSTGLQITFPPSKPNVNTANGREDLAWAVRLENLNY